MNFKILLSEILLIKIQHQGTRKQNNIRGLKTLKICAWSDESLENPLNAIIDEGMSLREASRVIGIPSSSIRDHLYGRTISRQRSTKPTLKAHEEKKL